MKKILLSILFSMNCFLCLADEESKSAEKKKFEAFFDEQFLKIKKQSESKLLNHYLYQESDRILMLSFYVSKNLYEEAKNNAEEVLKFSMDLDVRGMAWHRKALFTAFIEKDYKTALSYADKALAVFSEAKAFKDENHIVDNEVKVYAISVYQKSNTALRKVLLKAVSESPKN